MAIARIARRLWQDEGFRPGGYHEHWEKVKSALDAADEERAIAELLSQHQLLLEQTATQARAARPVRELREFCDGEALAELELSIHLGVPTAPETAAWGQTGHRDNEGEENASRTKQRSTGDAKFAGGVLAAPVHVGGDEPESL